MIVIYVKPIVVVCFVIGKYNPPESYGDFDTSEKLDLYLPLNTKTLLTGKILLSGPLYVSIRVQRF
jgi:hypothetical protein